MARWREFITLNVVEQNNKIIPANQPLCLNLDMIVEFREREMRYYESRTPYSVIYTVSGSSHNVKETYQELKELIAGVVEPEK